MEPEARKLIAKIVADEIVEVFDQLDSLCNRISVSRHPDLSNHLETAKSHVWQARMIAEGQE